MAGITYDKLEPALALNGGELFAIYQQGPTQVTPWIPVRATTAQIASFINNLLNLPAANYVSMQQLISALASEGLLVSVSDALPSDITNSYNIAWTHAFAMTISDPFITGFLQPTLGYTTAQMQSLFAFATNFPTVSAYLNTLLTPVPVIGAYASMRQLIAAMSMQAVLVGVFEALPADINNSYNIAWKYAYVMSINDPFVINFLQPTLGYSNPQMQVLFELAATLPV